MPWELDNSVLAGLVRMLRGMGLGKKSLKSNLNAHFGQFQRHGCLLVGCILLLNPRNTTEKLPKHESGAFYETIYFGSGYWLLELKDRYGV
jgi:hypothetical protein